MARMLPATRVAAAMRRNEAWARRVATVSEASWRRRGSLRQVRRVVAAPRIRAAKGSAMRKIWRPMWGRAANQSTMRRADWAGW